jgi:hypothetical protein
MSQIPQTPATQSEFGVIRTVLQTVTAFALRAPLFRVGLIVGGCWLVQVGLLVCLLVVVMFAQPGGIGAEKLLGPIFGFFALFLFFAGGACLYIGLRVKAQ